MRGEFRGPTEDEIAATERTVQSRRAWEIFNSALPGSDGLAQIQKAINLQPYPSEKELMKLGLGNFDKIYQDGQKKAQKPMEFVDWLTKSP